MKKWGQFAAVIVLLLGIGWWATRPPGTSSVSDSSTPSPVPVVESNPDELPGMRSTKETWDKGVTSLKERLVAIGLPALSEEGLVLHTHQHLDMFIHGKKIAIPSHIGIGPGDSFISHLHTHDETGIIHVESPVRQDFYLGQFFDVWGVKLSDTCVGGYCAEGENALRVYVNGSLVTSDVRKVVLANYQEIVVIYGTEKEMPETIPSTYTFPPEY